MYMPGFGGGIGSPELNVTPQIVSGVYMYTRLYTCMCAFVVCQCVFVFCTPGCTHVFVCACNVLVCTSTRSCTCNNCKRVLWTKVDGYPRCDPIGIVEQMRTFRKGAGNDIGLKLDLNYNFKTDGFIQIAKALTPEAVGGPGIDWLELDIYSPQALRQVGDSLCACITACEREGWAVAKGAGQVVAMERVGAFEVSWASLHDRLYACLIRKVEIVPFSTKRCSHEDELC